MKIVISLIFSVFSICLAMGQTGFPDPEYGNNGFLDLSSSGDFHLSPVTIKNRDGKIIHARTSNTVVGNDRWGKIEILRINSDGSLDGSFGQNGLQEVLIDSLGEIIDVALDPNNGKIYLACTSVDTVFYSPTPPMIVCLDSIGHLDTTFSNKGIKRLILGQIVKPNSIRVQENGKILWGGTIDSVAHLNSPKAVIIRVNPDGTWDPNFANNGIWKLNQFPITYMGDFELGQGNKIIVSGFGVDPNSSINGFITVTRLEPDGSHDSTFGFSGSNFYATSLDLIGGSISSDKNNGRIFIAGLSVGKNDPFVLCFDSTGALVNSFGNQGRTDPLDIPTGYMIDFDDLKVQPDGKILACGRHFLDSFWFYTNIGVVRFQTNGSVDTAGFGLNGFSSNDFDEEFLYPRDLLVLGNDSFLIGGSQIHYGPFYFGTFMAKYSNKTPIGIRNIDSEDGIHSFPNPFQNELTFTGNWNPKSKFTLGIFNILGKFEIEKEGWTNKEGMIYINLGELAPGIFFSTLSIDGTTYSTKIIKE